jgi:hypothetical protein
MLHSPCPFGISLTVIKVYIFGFFWGWVNVFIFYLYFSYAFGWLDPRPYRRNMEMHNLGQNDEEIRQPDAPPNPILNSRAFDHVWEAVHILIILPIAIIVSLGPFFSPYIGIKIAQREAWLHRCDPFAVEVILAGRAYSSPISTLPVASFYFWANGTRSQYYEYSLSQSDNDTNTWYFALTQVTPGVNIPAPVYPLISNVSYQFDTDELSAVCTAGPDAPANDTTSCMQGSFDTSYLSFTTNDTRTGVVITLRAIDTQWEFSEDAPSFLLKNSQGQTAVRTAVTEPEHCTFLKMCLANDTGVDMIPPVGLALMQQDIYSRICSKPSSN